MTVMSRRTSLALMGGALLSSAPAFAQTRTDLRLTSVDAYIKPVYEELARRFTAQAPNVTIQIEIVGSTWEGQLQRTFLDSTTNNKPDLCEQGLNLYKNIADRSIAYPLDVFATEDPDWQKRGYSSALLGLTSYRGQLWGLTFRLSNPILYVNADLVRRAGGDPDHLPTTWDELIALASDISKLGSGLSGMFFNYQASGAWTFLTLLNLQNARAMSDDGKRIAFDGPEGLRAFQILHDIGRSGMTDMPVAQAVQGFVAGQIGFFVNAGSLIESMKRQIDHRFDFRTAPLPKLSPQAKVPVGGGALMVLADDPERRRLAFEFARFATSAASQAFVAQQTGLTPANDLAVNEASLQQFYSQNPEHRANAQQLAMITDWETFPGPNAPKITDAIKATMQAVITGRAEPKAALSDLTHQVEALLSRS